MWSGQGGQVIHFSRSGKDNPKHSLQISLALIMNQNMRAPSLIRLTAKTKDGSEFLRDQEIELLQPLDQIGAPPYV